MTKCGCPGCREGEFWTHYEKELAIARARDEVARVATASTPIEPKPDPSIAIAAMRASRDRPKRITAMELVPYETHVRYAALWHEQQRRLEEDEALNKAYTWRMIGRRIVDRILGKPTVIHV